MVKTQINGLGGSQQQQHNNGIRRVQRTNQEQQLQHQKLHQQ